MSNVREDLDGWRSLVAHPKWKELVRISEEQRSARLVQIINGMDNLREENIQRGEYLGIGLILSVPQVQIDGLQVELDSLNSEE